MVLSTHEKHAHFKFNGNNASEKVGTKQQNVYKSNDVN